MCYKLEYKFCHECKGKLPRPKVVRCDEFDRLAERVREENASKNDSPPTVRADSEVCKCSETATAASRELEKHIRRELFISRSRCGKHSGNMQLDSQSKRTFIEIIHVKKILTGNTCVPDRRFQKVITNSKDPNLSITYAIRARLSWPLHYLLDN